MGALNTLSAVEAVHRLAEGKITSEALVRDCFERIDAREAEVQAWQHLEREAALKQARAADAGPRSGVLHGLPVGIKDIVDTIDMPTAYGSPIYAGHRPAWDASCVALTRAAGGIVIGKTVTTEFATVHPGKTRNPHNTRHTPGGSSSGSAAAVADYMVPLALGSQTGGSVIRPAAFCGVVGYKPSFGLISRVGVKALSDTLDTIGTFARTVPDAALFVAAITGRRDLMIAKPLSAKPRVGICRTYEWKQAQPEMMAALEAAAKKLAAAGVGLKDVNLPPTYASLVHAQTDIMFVEQALSLAYERLTRGSQLSERLRGILEAGLKVPLERYDAAQALARNCRRTLTEVFVGCDVLLAPSAPGAAPEGLGGTGDPLFNRMWTLLRVPCVNIPVATAANGLPVGLQVIGAFGSDAQTLAAARWLHEALGVCRT
ncbi:MAG: amidase [Betaproteobacteria bacterium]|nr:amidase [Betaproteobacteria bacterium]